MMSGPKGHREIVATYSQPVQSAMRITVVPARSLAPDHVRRWAELQDADSTLSSPFLCPEFSVAVAAVRDDVYVGILEAGRRAIGFFPYQRSRLAIGRPVGGSLNEAQGVIAEPGTDWGGVELVRGCGLAAWEFTRLHASQRPFEPFHYRRRRSAVIDVSRGWEMYAAETRHARRPLGLARKARKLAREAGPVRFEPHSGDPRLLEMLKQWKLHRYAAHGYLDVFAIPWVRHLFERIQRTQTSRFAGMMSVLYAGDDVVAVDMGIRSRTMWHSWDSAYNPTFAHYSPGLLLMMEMARHAATAGMAGIELGGCDEYPYKQRLMNRSVLLLEGTVGRVPVIAAVARWRYAGGNWIRRSRVLRPPARRLLRAYRRAKHTFLHARAAAD